MRYLKTYKLFECNVCGASTLIDGKTLTTKSSKGDEYEIKGYSDEAEFKPGKYQLRKNGGEWTKEFDTKDLAGEVSSGGFDVKSSSDYNDNWLEKHFK